MPPKRERNPPRPRIDFFGGEAMVLTLQNSGNFVFYCNHFYVFLFFNLSVLTKHYGHIIG